MTEFWQGLDAFLGDWWLFLLIFAGGIGEGLSRMFGGRAANRKLRAQLKAERTEVERLERLLNASITAASGGGPNGTQVAELAAQAKNALGDRTVLLTLLAQVRATDRAYPQLPEELATQVSETLDRMLPAGVRVDTEKAERKALRMPRKA